MTNQPIILGGGLSGLSACYHGNGIIYEKRNEIGGQARSHIENGFTFDEGIHVMHTNNQYILDLMETLEVGMDVRERDAWIVSHDAMTRYPFQANTYGLPVDIVKDCVLGFVENSFDNREKIQNYEDWVYFMFGKGIAEHFMIPYCKKFWGVDAKDLTTEWVNVRHPRPSTEEVVIGALMDQSKGFGVNAVYRYPKKYGFGNIAKCLAEKCSDRIITGMEATKIDVEKREIQFNNKKSISYEKILSTLPLPELIKIIPNAPSNVRDAALKLRTNSMFVVNIGVNRYKITEKNWIYYLEKKYPFVRVSFPSNQSDHVTPDGMSSISVEISYGNDNPLPIIKSEIANDVVKQLITLDILKEEDEIVYLKTIDVKYGYVIFDENRKPAIKLIHDYIKKHNIIPSGRYGLWKYLWSDEAILSGKKVAEEM
ncbi:MAG: protoporphyrinogen oxidase, partial [bacterium]